MSSNTTSSKSPKYSPTVTYTPRLSTSSTISPPYTDSKHRSSSDSKRSLTSILYRKSSEREGKKEKKEKRNYKMDSDENEAQQAARAYYFASK